VHPVQPVHKKKFQIHQNSPEKFRNGAGAKNESRVQETFRMVTDLRTRDGA